MGLVLWALWGVFNSASADCAWEFRTKIPLQAELQTDFRFTPPLKVDLELQPPHRLGDLWRVTSPDRLFVYRIELPPEVIPESWHASRVDLPQDGMLLEFATRSERDRFFLRSEIFYSGISYQSVDRPFRVERNGKFGIYFGTRWAFERVDQSSESPSHRPIYLPTTEDFLIAQSDRWETTRPGGTTYYFRGQDLVGYTKRNGEAFRFQPVEKEMEAYASHAAILKRQGIKNFDLSDPAHTLFMARQEIERFARPMRLGNTINPAAGDYHLVKGLNAAAERYPFLITDLTSEGRFHAGGEAIYKILAIPTVLHLKGSVLLLPMDRLIQGVRSTLLHDQIALLTFGRENLRSEDYFSTVQKFVVGGVLVAKFDPDGSIRSVRVVSNDMSLLEESKKEQENRVHRISMTDRQKYMIENALSRK